MQVIQSPLGKSNHPKWQHPPTYGFTLLELVIVMTIIGLLTSILIPAIQAVRESARRTQCSSNLQQIGLAISNYHSTHKMFPPGGNTTALSFLVAILPQMEQQNLYAQVDFNGNANARPNWKVALQPVKGYRCPSDGASAEAAANYAGNFGNGVLWHDYNGVFRFLRTMGGPYSSGPIVAGNITDGLSNTVAVSEILVGDGSWSRRRTNWFTDDFFENQAEFEVACSTIETSRVTPGNPFNRGRPWTEGNPSYTLYNHVFAPNQNSCQNGTQVQEGIYTAASDHPGGVLSLFADGHVGFYSDRVDRNIWRAIGSRDGSYAL